MTLKAPTSRLSRRQVLRGAACGALAAPLAFGNAVAAAATAEKVSRRVLRLAHLTDVHVQPERHAAEGLAQCLRHVHALADPAQLVITGGDAVMDSFKAAPERSQLLVELWRDVLQRECRLPVRHCLGNHDHRPWAPRTPGEVAGKQWAMDMYDLDAPYYAFDQAGWRFIVLDSVLPDGDHYTSGLDPAQRQWLETQLRGKPPEQPAVVVSHIPVISVTPLTHGDKRTPEDVHQIAGPTMHLDGASLHHLFRAHNVRLCLSGHIHLHDRCEVDGVTYICDGAVSAKWWNGEFHRVDEGYGLVDLYDDGRFDYAYTPYGWQAAPA